jgi:hypothetical protein
MNSELKDVITEMEGNVVSVTFSFDTKWEASSLESMEVLLNLIPATTIVGEELAKYYVVSILPTGMSIKLWRLYNKTGSSALYVKL